MLGVNKLLAFLRRSVGLRDDAASATGSLHAKVADLATTKHNALTASINTRQKPRGPASAAASFSTSVVTYQTALAVTGAGCLRQFRLTRSGGGTNTRRVYIRLTLDNIVIVSASFSSSSAPLVGYPRETFLFNGNIDALGGFTTDLAINPIYPLILNFKNRLTIEVRSEVSDTTATASWYCEIEE